MNHSVLYIVGNGFDIYHGISSRYSDFKEYLSDHNKNLYEYVIKYLPVEENWYKLEERLAGLDIYFLIGEAENCLYPYSDEDWSDSYHHSYQHELDIVVSALSRELKAVFCKWLASLDIPSHRNLGCSPLNLDKRGLFLNFNCTPTLQCVYQVPEQNILFIHGRCFVENSEIVLGHGWNPKEIPNLNAVLDPEGMDPRIMEGNSIINDYFGSTFKPTKKIIDGNKQFFDDLVLISKIYVLGHSLSEVDQLYIETVVNCVASDSSWKVSYLGEDERKRHEITMNQLGVENVEFCRIQEI